mmetsp:Transcript_11338/g.16968  ORF Transcript_11338/g.16968 Transcript_11338/m.16968 type:complete len:238 (+) Transcript_11338:324-1037(+)
MRPQPCQVAGSNKFKIPVRLGTLFLKAQNPKPHVLVHCLLHPPGGSQLHSNPQGVRARSWRLLHGCSAALPALPLWLSRLHWSAGAPQAVSPSSAFSFASRAPALARQSSCTLLGTARATRPAASSKTKPGSSCRSSSMHCKPSCSSSMPQAVFRLPAAMSFAASWLNSACPTKTVMTKTSSVDQESSTWQTYSKLSCCSALSGTIQSKRSTAISRAGTAKLMTMKTTCNATRPALP